MLTRYVQRHLTWIDLVSPTQSEVRSLMHEFGIDPLIAEELLSPSYKSKVEKRGEHLYVILHFPVLRGEGTRPEEEIDFFIGKHFLITARYAASDPMHAFARAFEVNSVLGRDTSMTHGGHIFTAMARNLYQALINECDVLDRHLQDIEEHIFTGRERDMVIDISQTGRTIHDFRQSLIPHKDMLSSLETPGARLFGVEFAYHLRTILGECERVEETLEHLRDSLSELRETNNSLLSTKQNEIMKTFTVLAFLFLPLSFLAALFGMSNIPFGSPGVVGGFWPVMGVMLVVVVACFWYFRHRDWI